MAVDDDISRYLKQVAELNPPPAWEQPLETVRQGIRELQLAAGGGAAVGSVEERAIATEGGGTLSIRIYRPPRPPLAGMLPPLIVYFHGGGFVLGDLDTHDYASRRLCADGDATVVSVDYRLAPEAPFPAAADDAVAATAWCLDHAGELGADPERVFVCGDSAGGNLATVAALALRGRTPGLAGQALIYPVTDQREGRYLSRTTSAVGYGLTQQAMEWFRDQYMPNRNDWLNPRASPMAERSVADAPPTFVMTAGYDPLCSEGISYVQKLERSGVKVEHLHLAGSIHGVFTNPERFRAGEVTWKALLKWLERVANGA